MTNRELPSSYWDDADRLIKHGTVVGRIVAGVAFLCPTEFPEDDIPILSRSPVQRDGVAFADLDTARRSLEMVAGITTELHNQRND